MLQLQIAFLKLNCDLLEVTIAFVEGKTVFNYQFDVSVEIFLCFVGPVGQFLSYGLQVHRAINNIEILRDSHGDWIHWLLEWL